jgi:hypothetical protein
MSSVTLLSSGFQRRTFFCFRSHVLSGWRPPETNFLLFQVPSQGSPVSQTYVTADDQSTSRSWFQIQSGAQDHIFILSDNCGFIYIYMGRLHWREDGSVIYNCCWPSPAQSFLHPCSAGLMAIFYSRSLVSSILECRMPVFISLRERVTQVYPQTLSSSLTSDWLTPYVDSARTAQETLLPTFACLRCLAIALVLLRVYTAVA